MSDLFPLFPTPVYKVALSKHTEFKKRFVPKLLEKYKKEPNKKAPWANLCHTWQINLEEIDTKDFTYIEEDLNAAIKHYLSLLNISSFKSELSGWFNVHNSDMYQELHNHIPAILSGIYYVQFDKHKDSQVLFKHPNDIFNAVINSHGLSMDNPNLGLHDGYHNYFSIEEGDLLLFPGSLDHLVPKSKQQHDQLRVTLSFNVTPTRPFIPSGTHET